MKITLEVAPGELIDKFTILLIKSDKITDQDKLNHVNKELDYVETIVSQIIKQDNLTDLMYKLRNINEELWDIEDKIRIKERDKEFDDEFITLARSVYKTNDERFKVKQEINSLFNSSFQEQKSYEEYS